MTIRHLFFWSVADEGKANLVLDELSSLAKLIPGLHNWAIGKHVGAEVHGSGAQSFDYALTCDFPDRSALQAYQVHPAHQHVLAKVFPLYANWAVVDLEISALEGSSATCS